MLQTIVLCEEEIRRESGDVDRKESITDEGNHLWGLSG